MSFIILKVVNELEQQEERPININRITNIEPGKNGNCVIWFNGDHLTVNHTMEELIGILPFAGVPIYPKGGEWAHVENKTIYRPGDEKVELHEPSPAGHDGGWSHHQCPNSNCRKVFE